MNYTLVGGLFFTLVGLLAYGVGTTVAYPGRAFSLTAIMVGLTMVLVGRREDPVT